MVHGKASDLWVGFPWWFLDRLVQRQSTFKQLNKHGKMFVSFLMNLINLGCSACPAILSLTALLCCTVHCPAMYTFLLFFIFMFVFLPHGSLSLSLSLSQLSNEISQVCSKLIETARLCLSASDKYLQSTITLLDINLPTPMVSPSITVWMIDKGIMIC